MDFGLAKERRAEGELQKLTATGIILGTPEFMSPEQLRGKTLDPRTDIYSLALLVYEMLTGKLPFQAETAWEWATQHMTQPPIPIESLAEGMRAPEAMRSAIKRALAKSPDERFQTVKEFIEAFDGSAPPAMAGKGGTTPLAVAQPGPAPSGRAKTEVGAPLDVAQAFGGPPPQSPPMGAPMPMGPMGGPAGGPGGAYTPAGGNVSYPTPAGIPQPPERGQGGGGGRTWLLVTAGLIGVASVVAIVFAMKGSSGGGGKSVVFDSGPSDPATTLVPGTPTDTPPVDTGSGGGDLPALSGGGKTPPPGPGPGPHNNPQPPGPQPPGPTPPGPTPPGPTPPGPKPGPKYDGPECQKARQLKAIGHAKEAEQWAILCIAKGGNPN
jgi:serine/threonine-protein kinase